MAAGPRLHQPGFATLAAGRQLLTKAAPDKKNRRLTASAGSSEIQRRSVYGEPVFERLVERIVVRGGCIQVLMNPG